MFTQPWPAGPDGGRRDQVIYYQYRYRTIELQAGPHTITAADPLPDDLRAALDHIHGRTGTHYLVTSQVLRLQARR